MKLRCGSAPSSRPDLELCQAFLDLLRGCALLEVGSHVEEMREMRAWGCEPGPGEETSRGPFPPNEARCPNLYTGETLARISV